MLVLGIQCNDLIHVYQWFDNDLIHLILGKWPHNVWLVSVTACGYHFFLWWEYLGSTVWAADLNFTWQMRPSWVQLAGRGQGECLVAGQPGSEPHRWLSDEWGNLGRWQGDNKLESYWGERSDPRKGESEQEGGEGVCFVFSRNLPPLLL